MKSVTMSPSFLPVLLWWLSFFYRPVGCEFFQYGGSGDDSDAYNGVYCGQRSGVQCCPGRVDECSVPLPGTLCYCDEFCNLTSLDCCPDFWTFCLGLDRGHFTTTTTPRPRVSTSSSVINECVDSGKYYHLGTHRRINCNECNCTEVSSSPKRYIWKCTDNVCLIRPQAVSTINNGKYGWTAGNHSKFWGLTLNDGIRYWLGTFYPKSGVFKMSSLRMKPTELPESFDCREKWPGWIGGIRDQRNCGASWAFTSAALAADKLAIESSGEINVILSPQQLLSCIPSQLNSCQGGNLDHAWWFLRKNGLVTESCYPYKSGQSMVKESCMMPMFGSPEFCPSGMLYKKEMKYKTNPPYRIAPKEQVIMHEIKNNGPVQALLEVKEDFYSYKSGIYRYSNLSTTSEENMKKGYHSVRIIGWGVDTSPSGEKTKYWLCANSWGESWGENGYFRIVRGLNECKIETFIISVWAKLPRRILNFRKDQKRLKKRSRHRH